MKSDLNFCRIWAMKESVGKLTGEGITSSFRDILVLHPEIHTRAIPLENGAGFLAYSTYSGRELPVMKVSAKQLLAELQSSFEKVRLQAALSKKSRKHSLRDSHISSI